MNKTAKWTLIILGLLIVVIVAAKALGGNDESGLKVTAEKAQRRTIIETVSVEGKIYPEVEVTISPDVSGEITELTVSEGDSVKRGQVLARIYADIYASQRDEAQSRVVQSQATLANSQAALESLKAQLDQAKTNYNRNRDLYDQKVISAAEFEQFQTALRSAQSQYDAALQNIRSLQAGIEGTKTALAQANTNLSRTVITAPMDGVISSLSVEKGERVAGNSFNVGTEMMRVADMSTIQVRVEVGENNIVKISLGDSADIRIEAYNNRKFRGVVTKIPNSPKTSSTLGTSASEVTNYEVHIRLDPASYSDLIDPSRPKHFPFRSGMNASAEIKTMRKDNAISVPVAAVAARLKGSDKTIEDGKKDKEKQRDNQQEETITISSDETEEVVFVIDKDGKAQKRKVTVGIQDMEYMEILSGLEEGEMVVTAPFDAVSNTLRSGTKVRVVPQDQLFKK